MQRPAEQLVSEIGVQIDTGRDMQVAGGGIYRLVSLDLLKKWKRLATRIDARMRLDGSPKNKQRRVSRSHKG